MHLSYDLNIIPMGIGYLIEYAFPEKVDLLDRYVLAARMNAGRRTDEVMLMKCILILQVQYDVERFKCSWGSAHLRFLPRFFFI
jgi:hypothetical protein